MPRWVAVALSLGFLSMDLHAQLPVIAPQKEMAPAAVPPAAAQAAPVPVPTSIDYRPWSVSCQPASVGTDPCQPDCAKKIGILTRMKRWLCGDTLLDPCDAIHPMPTVRYVVQEPCPAPVVCPKTLACPKPTISKHLPTRPTVECPKLETTTARRSVMFGSACERLVAFLCWKPCNETILPVFCPAPYQAPALAYVGPCREPVPGMPCGTCRKHTKSDCKSGSCPSPVGPVVKAHPVMGGWPTTAQTAMPQTTGVVPATAESKPQGNPLARPFTMP